MPSTLPDRTSLDPTEPGDPRAATSTADPGTGADEPRPEPAVDDGADAHPLIDRARHEVEALETRADELRVRAHLGAMEGRDRIDDATRELDVQRRHALRRAGDAVHALGSGITGAARELKDGLIAAARALR